MLVREKRRSNWKAILLEAFLVMLGVGAALAADEWREDAGNRRHAAAALASIREELATNRAAVASSVRYHLHLADTLGRLVRHAAPGEAGPNPDARLFPRGFVGPAPMLATAWEAAGATDAVGHMAYDDVLALGAVYEAQRQYAAQAETVGDLIYARMFDQGIGGILRNYANLNTILSTFWYRECRLLGQYEEVFAELDDAPVAADTSGVPPVCRQLIDRARAAEGALR